MYVPKCPNTYTYDSGGIYSANMDGARYVYVKDPHGSVTGVVNSSGAYIAQGEYTAFGERLDTNTDLTPFGYCGEYTDSESGLIYLRNRYYDPAAGRFISEDPAKDGLNWYAYCGNDPINRIDPTGDNWLIDAIKEFFKMQEEIDTLEMQANYETQKNIQREFWKYGAQHLLREKWGYSTSAWMLEHSLQDNPSDIRRGNYSRIAYLVNNDPAYLTALDKKIEESDNGIISGDLEDVVFSNGDLYYSIHKATINVNGYKQQDGSWIVYAKLTDKYDFTEIQTFMDDDNGWSGKFGIGTLANDTAVISQIFDAINPYFVTVEFYTRR